MDKECKVCSIELFYFFVVVLDATKKAETLLRIQNARQRVRNEIQDLTERLRITQENIKRLRKRSTDNHFSTETFTPVTNEIDD
jgi:hypothetical protein